MIVVLDLEGRSCSSTARAARSRPRGSPTCSARTGSSSPSPTTSATRPATLRPAHAAARSSGRATTRAGHLERPAAHRRLAQRRSCATATAPRRHPLLRRGRHGAPPPSSRSPTSPTTTRSPGCPTARCCEEHLKLALARSRRTGAGVALLHVDLDDFKLVNDSLGHAAGDELLCRLGGAPAGVVRATDLLARPGGDEFLLLLADLHDDADGAAERVAAPGRRRLPSRSDRRRRVPDLGLDRHLALAARRARRRDAARATPTPRCTRPRRPPAAAGRPTSPPAATRSSASRWPRACAARSARDEFALHYQPIFAADGGGSPASRRSCAGTTRSAAASSRPASSSRSPRRPA